MVNIKKFIDRVSGMDSLGNKDFVMSKNEARFLRDEIVKYIIDKLEDRDKPKQNEILEIHMSGGRW